MPFLYHTIFVLTGVLSVAVVYRQKAVDTAMAGPAAAGEGAAAEVTGALAMVLCSMPRMLSTQLPVRC